MSVDHYENFPVASILVPARLRPAIEAIYRFARGADDIADEGDAADAERLAGLAAFRAQLRRVADGRDPAPEPEGRMFAHLGRVIREHGLPAALFEDLLDAFSQDVVKKRYADQAELADYCRRSANPVGRLLLALYRHDDAQSLERSDAICTSLQLINFWQDVPVDLQKGRVYIPRDTLARCGFRDDEIPLAFDARLREALRSELARARALMLCGVPLAAALPGRIGWELALVVQGGLRIIEKIERQDCDVFACRPVLTRRDWLLMGFRAMRFRLGGSVQ